MNEERARLGNEIRFCHGDTCLPNVLIKDNQVSGMVDWSGGGYADYRFDLATALWSLRRNGLSGQQFARRLLDGYGFEGDVEELLPFEALYVLIG